MSKIWKFELAHGEQTLEMPKLEDVVHAGIDNTNTSCIWAQVDPSTDKRKFEVRVVATGEEFDREKWLHCKTWSQGPLVWHLLILRNGYWGAS
jgi:hypothetical protein